MAVLFCCEEEGIYGTFYYESEDHQHCKRILTDWLNKQKIDALCEYRIPGLDRRADIYFHYMGEAFVFEVQLSHMSPTVYSDRTRDYIRAGIIPYWIGAGKLNKNARNVPFHCLDECYIRHAPVPHALYIDMMREILFIRHSFSYEKHKSVRAADTKGKSGLTMKELRDPLTVIGSTVFFDECAKQSWLNATRYKRTKRYVSLNTGERETLKVLQSHGLNLNYFPAICRVPLRNQFVLRTHPEIWQTWFLLKLAGNEWSPNQRVALSAVTERMAKAVRCGVIQFRENSMRQYTGLLALTKEYLEWLVWIGVLAELDTGIYVMRKQVTVKKTLETLFMDDRFIMNEIGNYLEYRKE